VKITEDSRDAGLPDRLRAEAPGILNWLIEGCLMWQAEGLKMCSEVELATAEYKIDMDIVTEFLNEYTIKGDYEKTISNTMLRDKYNEWALIRGYKKLTPQTFSSKMRERGHEGSIKDGSRIWHHLKLKDIEKRTLGGLVEDLKGMETLPSGLRGLNSKSLEKKKIIM
jgi:putative DNA primase/helicase